MKHLFVVLLMLLSFNLYSQTFTATTGISSGLEIDAAGNFTEVQGTFEIQPQLTVDKFTISAVGLTLIKKEVPTFYVGSEAGYVIWVNNTAQKNSVSLTSRYLYGSGGQQLLGAGLGYNIDRTIVKANGDWNYKMKTALVTLGVNYTFMK